MNRIILCALLVTSAFFASEQEKTRNLYLEQTVAHLLKEKEYYTRDIKHLDEQKITEEEDPFVEGCIGGYMWMQNSIRQQYEACKEDNSFYEIFPAYIIDTEEKINTLYLSKGKGAPGIFAKRGFAVGAENAVCCWLINNTNNIPSSSEYNSLSTLFAKNPLIFLAQQCHENHLNKLLAGRMYKNYHERYYGLSNKTFKMYAPILFDKERINTAFNEIINVVTIDPKLINTFIYSNDLFCNDQFINHFHCIATLWDNNENFKTTNKFDLPLCLSFCEKIERSGCFVNHKPYIGSLMAVAVENVPQDALEQTPEVKIDYLKAMLKPSGNRTIELEEFEGKTKEKVVTFLCSLNAFKKTRPSLRIIPKGIINTIILPKLATYQKAENLRFIIKWDIEKTKVVSETMQNVDELTMPDHLRTFLTKPGTEKVINFIINDLLPWFDEESLK